MIFGSSEATTAIGILCLLISIAAAVLAFVFITPDKKRAKLNGFGKFLHDLCNFKFLIIEKIFQFFYILATSFVLVFGFFSLFSFERSYYGTGDWVGYNGLLLMILGPIAVRIAYEFIMMTILAIKNIIQINNKLKNQNDGDDSTSPFGSPVASDYATPKASQQTFGGANAGGFCPNCGSPKAPNGICPNCGQ